MSVKEKRNVTFEVPETKPGSNEPNVSNNNNNISTNNNKCKGKSFNKDDSLSRSRARSRSWSRFRARRTKSQDARPTQDSDHSSYGTHVGTKRDRSLVSLVRTGSRNSVRTLVKIFEIRSMNEGRKSQIVLLDERRLDIIIQPKLYSNELLDLVASHFKLKEKQYFGLGFLDETNHFNWLQGEKRVLDHEFPKKTGLLVLHFAIKFYVDTIGLLRDIQTVELFYLNARQLLFRGHLECDTETVFELAAHVLQATNGDFVSEEETREELKKLPVIPTCTLKEHPSIAFCEDRVIHFYEKINGTSRGLAIVNYMTIVEKIPTYGIHYYDVKDKKDIPWWLGISPKGIAVYDKNDKTTPRKFFTWKNLENLYYRDRKFSIEVHGPKRIVHTRSSFNTYQDVVREPPDRYDDLSTAISADPTTQVSVSRRTFGASNVDVHAWFAGTPQLTKCIWSMAVVQHQFYLDRKQSRSQLTTARSMSEIAADLCRSTTSLPGSLGSDLSRSPSSHSLPSLSNSRYDLTIEQSDSLKAERDMYQALKARREALEESLRKKTEELKLLCLQEGELIGELPNDFPLGPGEQPPVFRRRVGTAFSLTIKSGPDTDQLSTELSKLEMEVELQGKITAAAHRLASDKTVSKYVRKQRRQSYTKAYGKLKDMENKLDHMRKKGKPPSNDHQAGRSTDGMYHVLHLDSKCDLDFDDTVSVHDLSAIIQDDVSGSVGDISQVSGSTVASSGRMSPSCSSLNSSMFQQVIREDGSSGSDRTNSYRDTVSIDSRSQLVGDSSRNVQTQADDGSLKQVHSRRKKYFIVGSGQNNRVAQLKDDINQLHNLREFRVDFNQSQSYISTSGRVSSSTTVLGPNHDSDSTFDDSLADSDFFNSSENDSRDEEQKASTKVQRRGQTFIASRAISKDFTLEHERLAKGWKEFEQILLGEDKNKQSRNREPVNCSTLQHGSVARVHANQSRTVNRTVASPSDRTQHLLDRREISRPARRSRSFDCKPDMIVRERMGDESNQSRDDMKLVKLIPNSKESTLKKRKPFIFIAKKQNSPSQLRHFLSEVQTSSLTRCTTAAVAPHCDISVNKVHLDQACLNENC